jgi:hypothetical protein
LGRPSDNRADDRAGQHDFEVVAVLHCGHAVRQQRADEQAEGDAPGDRMHLACEPARGDAGDHPFDGRADHDADDSGAHGRREPRRRAVDCAKNGAEQKPYENLVHDVPPKSVFNAWPKSFNDGPTKLR